MYKNVCVEWQGETNCITGLFSCFIILYSTQDKPKDREDH